jgi:hypothetical protein
MRKIFELADDVAEDDRAVAGHHNHPSTRNGLPSAPLRPQRLSAFPSLQPSATAQPQALQVWGGTAPCL